VLDFPARLKQTEDLMSSKSKTTKSKKTTAAKAKAPAKSTADRAARVEAWRAAYRLANAKPMSLSPKMTDARMAHVITTWDAAARKRVTAALARAK
jgi:hypothetical protein